MKGVLAVFLRDLEERRFVFGAAAVSALAPFVVPVVRGLHGDEARQMQAWLGFLLAALFAAGLAITLGTTAISSDLAERRLGFYLSRPISGFALWAGKLGAACVATLGASALVYAPTLLAQRGSPVLLDLPRGTPALSVAAALVLVFAVHAGSLLLRPRSSLLALDMAALFVLTVAAVYVLRLFAMALAGVALRRATLALAAEVALGLLLGGLLAGPRGRTDGRAAHATLSATRGRMPGSSPPKSSVCWTMRCILSKS